VTSCRRSSRSRGCFSGGRSTRQLWWGWRRSERRSNGYRGEWRWRSLAGGEEEVKEELDFCLCNNIITSFRSCWVRGEKKRSESPHIEQVTHAHAHAHTRTRTRSWTSSLWSPRVQHCVQRVVFVSRAETPPPGAAGGATGAGGGEKQTHPEAPATSQGEGAAGQEWGGAGQEEGGSGHNEGPRGWEEGAKWVPQKDRTAGCWTL